MVDQFNDERVAKLISRLAGTMDAAGILIAEAISDGYAADATARGEMPLAVFRPRTTAEVSAILFAANELRQPIVVQGGRTGISGGARPLANEVSLSLERMSGIESVDVAAQTIIVGAGTPLQVLQQAAADANLYFGVDIGARGTATVGGNIATNAGGIRVLRYGMYRAQVAGVEAVLPDGTVLSSLKGLPKDNSGYDLSPLFIGTEGTVGVITRACLRLHPKPKVERNAFLTLPSLEAAQALLAKLRVDLSGLLSAFEVIFPSVYERTVAYMGIRPPVEPGGGMYAMVEIQGQSPETDSERLETALAAALEEGLATDVVLSNSLREFNGLWAVREGIIECLFGKGAMMSFDISVPLSRMPEFINDTKRSVAGIDPAAGVFIFGHLGDGNLHFCVSTSSEKLVAKAVYKGIAAVGGGVTAEHGVGTDKEPYLGYVRSSAEIETMRRLKATFDPNAILNRGRVFRHAPPHSQRVV